MKYYISRYLNIVKTKYGSLFFSGVNGAIDRVSDEITRVFESGSIEQIASVLNENEINHMLERGYLTRLEPEKEENAFVKFVSALRENSQKSVENGSLMLLLTYNCNLACPYCYQKEHRHKNSGAVMSEDLIDRIFNNLYEKIIPNLKIEKMRIMFYGGEPFLTSNRKAIDRALEYAHKYQIQSSAITNATFEDSMANIFGPQPGQVNWCQVSLDGPKRLHDKSRVPLDGRPTFDKIVSNVKLMLESGVKVSLRLNLDRTKIESVEELMEQLHSGGVLGHKNLNIYASPLHDNIAKVDATDFLDLSELSGKLFEKGIDLEHPVSGRANEMNLLLTLKKGLGLNRTDFCMQSAQRTIVVDPFGDLYACFEEAGYPEFRIGTIKGKEVEFFPLKEFYLNRHIGNLEECRKCSVALACGGQCGAKCRMKTGDIYKTYCENMKEVILNALRVSYERFKEKGVSSVVETVSTHE